MPVEILTKEEIEIKIEDMLRKIIEESPLSMRLSHLEKEINDIKTLLTKKELPSKTSPDHPLITDLREKVNLLEIRLEKKLIILKPKHWLNTEDFKEISEIVKKHGGAWSTEQRSFILKKVSA